MKKTKKIVISLFTILLLLALPACTKSSEPAPTESVPEESIPEPVSTESIVVEPVLYQVDILNANAWPKRSDLTITGDRVTFMPEEFDQVWSSDFKKLVGDFSLTATFSYDTNDIDEYGVAVLIGDPESNNFYFLGPNPYQGNTIWFFVMVKDGEYVHPLKDPPITEGQPDVFNIEIKREGDQVSAYVNNELIMQRTDIIFEGNPAMMEVGLHADGFFDTVVLSKMAVSAQEITMAASDDVSAAIPEDAASNEKSSCQINGQLQATSEEVSIAGRSLVLCDRTQPGAEDRACTLTEMVTTSDQNGAFEFCDVPDGNYLLYYDSEWMDFDAGVEQWKNKEIKMNDRDWLHDNYYVKDENGDYEMILFEGMPLDLDLGYYLFLVKSPFFWAYSCTANCFKMENVQPLEFEIINGQILDPVMVEIYSSSIYAAKIAFQ